MGQLQPFYEQVQAHYDLSNEFFALFLDPSMTYSCAYFAHPELTLAEAQQAKLDLSLEKCDLQPGQRLLDIGCGWGSAARRAATRFGVDVIGLTLSRNQHAYAERMSRHMPPGSGRIEFRLQGWEEFEEPVDAIVSIGAFEHFRLERHAFFFKHCYELLPAGGRMLLHSIVWPGADSLRERGIEAEHEHVLFAKFIRKSIFPGGQLCAPEVVIRHAEDTGFEVARVQSLQPHYARTLDCWAANLQARREAAIVLTSPEVYEMYMHYLTDCARYFRSGHIDVMQFTLKK